MAQNSAPQVVLPEPAKPTSPTFIYCAEEPGRDEPSGSFVSAEGRYDSPADLVVGDLRPGWSVAESVTASRCGSLRASAVALSSGLISAETVPPLVLT